MRRFITLAVAAGIAASSVAAPAFAAHRHAAPAAESGYYVIRWENTGICQIWNTNLQSKPVQWPSTYKVISQPVPTFNEASAIQMQLRDKRTCTL